MPFHRDVVPRGSMFVPDDGCRPYLKSSRLGFALIVEGARPKVVQRPPRNSSSSFIRFGKKYQVVDVRVTECYVVRGRVFLVSSEWMFS
jgi:hypothetical protein